MPKPFERTFVHAGLSCDGLSKRILKTLRDQIESPSLFCCIVRISSKDLQDSFLDRSPIAAIPFLHFFAVFIVSGMRHLFARTQKTHKHMDIVVPEDLPHVF